MIIETMIAPIANAAGYIPAKPWCAGLLKYSCFARINIIAPIVELVMTIIMALIMMFVRNLRIEKFM